MNWGVSNQTIQELEDKLFSEILMEQRLFNCVRAPQEEKIDYAAEISKGLNSTRGTINILSPLFSGRGHGPFVELVDGSVKYDLIGGIGPYILGHSHPLQIRSFLKAARGSYLNSTNFIPSYLSVQLAKSLLDFCADSSLNHCWFCGSGSMANDSAMRLLWDKRKPRTRIIAFENSFAGRSLVMQSITQGKSEAKDLSVDYIPFPKDHDSAELAKKTLKKLLSDYGDNYIAFYGELVQGEAGINLPIGNELAAIFQLLRDSNIPIWVDEVQTFARTTKLFAFQKFQVEQFVDICTIGKAFNLSAVLFSSTFSLDQGLGGTFQGNMSSILFAQDLLRLFNDAHFFEPSGRAASLEKNIETMFKEVSKESVTFSHACNAHGIGLMWAMTFSNGSISFIEMLMKELFDRGIISWRAGRKHLCIRLLFPYTLTQQHLTEIKKIIISTLSQLNVSEL